MNELSLGMSAAEAVQTECLMVLVETLSESLDALEATPTERRAVWRQLEIDLRLSPGGLGD
jgi:hypothetical protein